MSGERWLSVPGYEGLYEVSDMGRVRTTHPRYRAPRVMRLRVEPRKGGYLFVSLVNSERKRRLTAVHQLVAAAFLGPRPHKYDTRHLDGDKTNARLDNLAYGTRAENLLDEVRLGRHYLAARTHCPQGHPFIGDNVKLVVGCNGRPFRECRACRAAIYARHDAKRRAS